MRLTVLGDVHGNSWALRAVLADAEQYHPHHVLLLGDLLADGPDPLGTLALLQSLQPLPSALSVRGNTDRYLADLARVGPPRCDMPDLLATWRWAVDLLGEEGRTFLAALPGELALDTPAGRVVAAHGVPGDDEGLLLPDRPDTWAALDWRGARLLLVAHTHQPFTLHAGPGLVVNPGSVGLPEPTGWRASYALVDLYPGGDVAVRHLQVPWDIAAFVAAFEGGIPINRKAEPMLRALRCALPAQHSLPSREVRG